MRALFLVYAAIVDANGTFNTLSGYPQVFDSKNYDGDTDKARKRAYGAYHECLGAMAKNDARLVQFAMIIDASSGQQIEIGYMGNLNPTEVPEDE